MLLLLPAVAVPLLPAALEKVSARDRGLLQQLCYGCLRLYPRLQAQLTPLLPLPSTISVGTSVASTADPRPSCPSLLLPAANRARSVAKMVCSLPHPQDDLCSQAKARKLATARASACFQLSCGVLTTRGGDSSSPANRHLPPPKPSFEIPRLNMRPPSPLAPYLRPPSPAFQYQAVEQRPSSTTPMRSKTPQQLTPRGQGTTSPSAAIYGSSQHIPPRWASSRQLDLLNSLKSMY